MSAKDRAQELYTQHLALASTDGRLFRKTIMDTLMADFGIGVASAATLYNNAKKANPPIVGLGRAPLSPNMKKALAPVSAAEEGLQEETECFAVVEVCADGRTGRTQTFLLQGGASEVFDEKTSCFPQATWVMIKGIGPIYNEPFKLLAGETELKRWTAQTTTEVAAVPAAPAVDEDSSEQAETELDTAE